MQHRVGAARLRLMNDRPPLLKIAHQVPNMFPRGGELEFHNWFQQDRSRLVEGIIEGNVCRRTKRDFGGITHVDFAAQYGHLESHEREPQYSTTLSGYFQFFKNLASNATLS